MGKNSNCFILAVIQARVGSTRLPGKVLMALEGKTVLEHVVVRVRAARLISDLVVATTIEKTDDKIEALCKRIGARCFRGSEDDVLDRFYQAAIPFNPDYIVRITSDCPVIDPKVIDKTIALHLSKRSDYTGNRKNNAYPDGEDVEVFGFNALKKSWQEACLSSEREHVTPYIKKHSECFKYAYLECPEDISSYRWTLDRIEDYTFIKLLYENLYKKNNIFGMKEILRLLKKHPEYVIINKHIVPDEGYLKSLKEDKFVK